MKLESKVYWGPDIRVWAGEVGEEEGEENTGLLDKRDIENSFLGV